MDKVEDTKRFLGEGVTKEEKGVEHMTRLEHMVCLFQVFSPLLLVLAIALLAWVLLKCGTDLFNFFFFALYMILPVFFFLFMYAVEKLSDELDKRRQSRYSEGGKIGKKSLVLAFPPLFLILTLALVIWLYSDCKIHPPAFFFSILILFPVSVFFSICAVGEILDEIKKDEKKVKDVTK